MPINEFVTIQQVLEILNRMIEEDPWAVNDLINQRVVCGKKLADDPTVQVGIKHKGENSTTYEVGLLGVLNGLFGIDSDGWGAIAAVYSVTCKACSSNQPVSTKVGDPCTRCGAETVLGDLLKFEQVRPLPAKNEWILEKTKDGVILKPPPTMPSELADAMISQAHKKLSSHTEETYCAFCQKAFPLDGTAAEAVTEHIKTCEKHPMRAAEAKIKELEDENAELLKKLFPKARKA